MVEDGPEFDAASVRIGEWFSTRMLPAAGYVLVLTKRTRECVPSRKSPGVNADHASAWHS